MRAGAKKRSPHVVVLPLSPPSSNRPYPLPYQSESLAVAQATELPAPPRVMPKVPAGEESVSSSSKRAPVKRACDQCHFRRVKCDGQAPCDNCSRLSVNCTYEKPRLRSATGKRINAIRMSMNGEQTQPDGSSSSYSQPTPHQHPNGGMGPPSEPHQTHGTEGIDFSSTTLQSVTYQDSTTWASSSAYDPSVSAWPVGVDIADFFESSFSALSPETAASLRLPNVETQLPESFLQPREEDALGFFRGFPTFLHPSPPSYVPPIINNHDNSNSPPIPLSRTASDDLTSNAPISLPSVLSAPSVSSLPSAPSHTSIAVVPPTNTPLTESVLIPSIGLFFERIHPIMPIFTRSWLFSRLDRGHQHSDPQFAAMLLAMSALVLTQPLASYEQGQAIEKRAQARQLMEDCVRMRSSALFGQVSSLDCILTSLYLFACLFGMKEDGAGWFRLTEAVTLAQLLKLHVPSSYDGLEHDERERRLRTYWILCITERAYALQRGHSIAFRGRPSHDMHTVSDGLRIGELDDFPIRHLKLFDCVDENFVNCWHGRCAGRNCKTLDRTRAIALNRALSDQLNPEGTPASMENFEVFSSLASNWKRGEIQTADVLVTQQWLLNRLWRLCMLHGLLDEKSPEPALRFDLPMRIAHTTLAIVQRLSMTSIEAHGIGFLEKLYDIVTTLAAIAAYPAALASEPSKDGLSFSQLLGEYVTIFKQFRGGDHPFLVKLLEAVGHLLQP